MKKLLAILLSALMLCAMIPFATVAAAADEDHYIELVADAEEVDAGDYVAIAVSLYGHEDLGIIGLLLELGFDHDVFELETTYDEDEEMWVAPIEVGPKFNASSSKYIMFSPIDEETGYMGRCLVKFDRATASTSQAVKTNLYFTVTFKVKDDAVTGDYTIDLANYNKTNIVMYGLATTEWSYEPITIHVNGSEPACEHEYFSPCDKICSICGEESNPDASHSVSHVEAKAATCSALGNLEYWGCDVCGMAWLNEECTLNTNRFAVILPMVDHTYANAHDTDCDVCGDVREIPVADIVIPGGNSISEEKNGLAFKFDAAINGIVIGKSYVADYTNATITVNGVECKLVKMGAVLNNKGYANQTIADVDGQYVVNVEAAKVFEADGTISYAIRVINIPAEKKDAEIVARSYFVYNNGVEDIIVYGEDWTTSYNAELN